ncbi:MAG: hypothetical protein IJ602_01580 [Paludibacteraceae bacterium]|nr:hypothetical protein [Paludibacteraceae bacterium]
MRLSHRLCSPPIAAATAATSSPVWLITNGLSVHIHTLPSELPTVISELGARRVLTYHNSKYALANHSWTEPLDSIYAHAQGKSWQLLTPRIGERVRLNEQQTFRKWWR